MRYNLFLFTTLVFAVTGRADITSELRAHHTYYFVELEPTAGHHFSVWVEARGRWTEYLTSTTDQARGHQLSGLFLQPTRRAVDPNRIPTANVKVPADMNISNIAMEIWRRARAEFGLSPTIRVRYEGFYRRLNFVEMIPLDPPGSSERLGIRFFEQYQIDGDLMTPLKIGPGLMRGRLWPESSAREAFALLDHVVPFALEGTSLFEQANQKQMNSETGAAVQDLLAALKVYVHSGAARSPAEIWSSVRKRQSPDLILPNLKQMWRMVLLIDGQRRQVEFDVHDLVRDSIEQIILGNDGLAFKVSGGLNLGLQIRVIGPSPSEQNFALSAQHAPLINERDNRALILGLIHVAPVGTDAKSAGQVKFLSLRSTLKECRDELVADSDSKP